MVIDLAKQILVKGVIPTEWELSTIFNCCKEKGNAFQRDETPEYSSDSKNSGESFTYVGR